MKVNSVISKTVIGKSKIKGVKYSYNPYIGCEHNCLYCFANYMKKYTNHDNDEWGTFVDVKINAVELLEKELSKKEYKDVIFIGTVTDCYQPIEKEYEITRESLKVLLKHKCKISILTKSNLVLRDIDLLKQFDYVEVGISCSFYNDKDRSFFEPNTVSIRERVEALKILKENGIKTYLFIAPFIPHISNIEMSIKLFKNYVDYIILDSLNFIGPDKTKLIKALENYGEKKDKILVLLNNPNYYVELKKYFNDICKRYGIVGINT
jgi:DNA repair photolyase